jgi:hypothetical protein
MERFKEFSEHGSDDAWGSREKRRGPDEDFGSETVESPEAQGARGIPLQALSHTLHPM